MKSPTRNVIKSHLAQIAQLACRVPLLRLHPKLRWLDVACPIIEDLAPEDTISKRRRRNQRRRRPMPPPHPAHSRTQLRLRRSGHGSASTPSGKPPLN